MVCCVATSVHDPVFPGNAREGRSLPLPGFVGPQEKKLLSYTVVSLLHRLVQHEPHCCILHRLGKTCRVCGLARLGPESNELSATLPSGVCLQVAHDAQKISSNILGRLKPVVVEAGEGHGVGHRAA